MFPARTKTNLSLRFARACFSPGNVTSISAIGNDPFNRCSALIQPIACYLVLFINIVDQLVTEKKIN